MITHMGEKSKQKSRKSRETAKKQMLNNKKAEGYGLMIHDRVYHTTARHGEPHPS